MDLGQFFFTAWEQGIDKEAVINIEATMFSRILLLVLQSTSADCPGVRGFSVSPQEVIGSCGTSVMGHGPLSSSWLLLAWRGKTKAEYAQSISFSCCTGVSREV